MALTYPRDAHVQYQEELRRLAEDDVVDARALRKVEISVQHLSKDVSTAKVIFLHEDHTLGNALRHVVMQNPATSVCGYSIPHPLEPRMAVQVQAAGFAPDVVAEGLEELAQICEQWLGNFEDCIATQSSK
jgi:DNA-directed RNA polymerase I and III subunit RPAC2